MLVGGAGAQITAGRRATALKALTTLRDWLRMTIIAADAVAWERLSSPGQRWRGWYPASGRGTGAGGRPGPRPAAIPPAPRPGPARPRRPAGPRRSAPRRTRRAGQAAPRRRRRKHPAAAQPAPKAPPHGQPAATPPVR